MAKKIARKGSITKTEAENSQLELFQINQTKKVMEKRERELKERLGEYMMNSIKADAKGHFLFSTVSADGSKVHLQRQARKKVTLNEERAKSILQKLGTEIAEEVIAVKTVIAEEVTQDQVIDILQKHAPHLLVNHEYVDEQALEQAVLNEKVTMEQFEDMCDINITYAMTFIDDKRLQQDE